VLEGDPPVSTHFAHATPVAGRPGTWRVEATRAELSRQLAALLATGAVLVECAPEQGRLASAFHEAVRQ
jgi:hypothetical protein